MLPPFYGFYDMDMQIEDDEDEESLSISSWLFWLFELMFYVTVNSKGHVGTLPPFYGTSS